VPDRSHLHVHGGRLCAPCVLRSGSTVRVRGGRGGSGGVSRGPRATAGVTAGTWASSLWWSDPLLSAASLAGPQSPADPRLDLVGNPLGRRFADFADGATAGRRGPASRLNREPRQTRPPVVRRSGPALRARADQRSTNRGSATLRSALRRSSGTTSSREAGDSDSDVTNGFLKR
jgi:hypothetical protein